MGFPFCDGKCPKCGWPYPMRWDDIELDGGIRKILLICDHCGFTMEEKK